MTDDTKTPKVRLKVLQCRRTGLDYSVEQHLQCPYCFGEEKDFEKRDYSEFCDFRRGEDPVHFGFPEESTRNMNG